MTVGELARLFNEEREIGAALTVVPMDGWRRELWFDETGLPWVNPSPNIRSLEQAILYPGIALLEGLTNYSVGRGTDTPFRAVGADWINASELARELSRRAIPGVRFYPRLLRPRASHFSGKTIQGIQISIVDRDSLRSIDLGLEIAAALLRLYPNRLHLEQTKKLLGERSVIEQLLGGVDARTISAGLAETVEAFQEKRRRFLLY